MVKSGVCKLCLRQELLRKSHIIPEWAYRSLYDNGAYLEINTQRPNAVRHRRKGDYERLLCDDCESYFGMLDEYGRAVIYSTSEDPTFGISCNGFGDEIIVYDVVYGVWKLFQLSVLWRQAVSQRPIFSGFSIPDHEEAVRRMLICGDPGAATEYGCIVSPVLLDRETLCDFLMLPPKISNFENLQQATLFLAGCSWTFMLSDNCTGFRFEGRLSAPERVVVLKSCMAQDLPMIVGVLSQLRDLLPE